MPLTLRLREVRRERHLTQADLAERAGVRQATVSDLEKRARAGELHRLDLDIVDRLAVALGVSPAALLVEDSGPTRRASRRG